MYSNEKNLSDLALEMLGRSASLEAPAQQTLVAGTASSASYETHFTTIKCHSLFKFCWRISCSAEREA